jgi:hypothetical protein
MKLPQWKSIYLYMKNGNSITTYQSYSLFKCTRLPDRIRDIERLKGIKVNRKWKKTKYSQVREYSF